MGETSTRTTVITAAILVATPALAQITEIDTEGDELVTCEGTVAVYPNTTPEAFAQVDSSADGAVDDGELTAAIDAGLVPPAGG